MGGHAARLPSGVAPQSTSDTTSSGEMRPASFRLISPLCLRTATSMDPQIGSTSLTHSQN